MDEIKRLPYAPFLRSSRSTHVMAEYAATGGVLPRFAQTPIQTVNNPKGRSYFQLTHENPSLIDLQNTSVAIYPDYASRNNIRQAAKDQAKCFRDMRKELHIETSMIKSLLQESMVSEQNQRLYDGTTKNALACVKTDDEYYMYHPGGSDMNVFRARKLTVEANRPVLLKGEGTVYEDMLPSEINEITTSTQPGVIRHDWSVAVRCDREVRLYACNSTASISRMDTLQFGSEITHASPSPYMNECVFAMGDGTMCMWVGADAGQTNHANYGSYLRCVYKTPTYNPQFTPSWAWADYLSHPCVLAHGFEESIGLVDTRMKNVTCGTKISTVLHKEENGMIRAAVCSRTNTFEIALASDNGLCVIDSRMPGRSVLQFPCFPGSDPGDMIEYAGQNTILMGTSTPNQSEIVAYRLGHTDNYSSCEIGGALDLMPKFLAKSLQHYPAPTQAMAYPQLMVAGEDFASNGKLLGMVACGDTEGLSLLSLSTTGAISSRYFTTRESYHPNVKTLRQEENALNSRPKTPVLHPLPSKDKLDLRARKELESNINIIDFVRVYNALNDRDTLIRAQAVIAKEESQYPRPDDIDDLFKLQNPPINNDVPTRPGTPMTEAHVMVEKSEKMKGKPTAVGFNPKEKDFDASNIAQQTTAGIELLETLKLKWNENTTFSALRGNSEREVSNLITDSTYINRIDRSSIGPKVGTSASMGIVVGSSFNGSQPLGKGKQAVAERADISSSQQHSSQPRINSQISYSHQYTPQFCSSQSHIVQMPNSQGSQSTQSSQVTSSQVLSQSLSQPLSQGLSQPQSQVSIIKRGIHGVGGSQRKKKKKIRKQGF
eukprot:CFRG2923T1